MQDNVFQIFIFKILRKIARNSFKILVITKSCKRKDIYLRGTEN